MAGTPTGGPSTATRAGERVEPGPAGPRPVQMTPAEARLAPLIVAGRSNAEIGRELFITANTVKTQLHQVFARNGIASRTQLAAALVGSGQQPAPAPGPRRRSVRLPIDRPPSRAAAVMDGSRAAVLSAAVRHAIAALRVGRTAEALRALQDAAAPPDPRPAP